MGEAGKPAIAHLIDLLDQDYVGEAAARALRNIGPASIVPLAQVAAELSRPEALRVAALITLGDIGPDAAEAASHIAGVLQQPGLSIELVDAACYAIGADGRVAVPPLLDLLQHPDSLIRLEAARALGKIGSLTSRELARLIAALDTERTRLASVSQGNVDARGEPVSTQQRARHEWEIQDDEHRCARVQMEMVLALSDVQRCLPWEDARNVILPSLIRVIGQPHPAASSRRWHPMHHGTYCPVCHLYVEAAKALRFYGSAARPALPALRDLLEHERARHDVNETIRLLDECYLDPYVLPAAQGWGRTALVVRREEYVSDDHQHLILALRIRGNTLSREELARVFPNAVEGWVKMGNEVSWGPPDDQLVAERVAKIPAQRDGQVWIAWISLPKIENTELYLWDSTYHDYSGSLHELPSIWSSTAP
jgi:hypothetical protein